MGNLKILHISPNFPYPPDDGGRIVIYNSYKHLKAIGNRISFICISKEHIDDKYIRQFDLDSHPEVYEDASISSYWRIIRCLILGESYFINKFYSRKFLNVLTEKIAASDYDVLHFEGLHIVPYIVQIRKKFPEARIVVRLHNIESQIFRRFSKNTKNIFLKSFFKREAGLITEIETWLYENIPNVVFISEEDKNNSLISKYKNSNPYVLSAGVDPEYFAGLDNSKPRSLLYLGSMDWKPNEDAVIWFIEKVYGKLLIQFPDLKFYIVGKNPSARLKAMADENIIITGRVDDVRPYIKEASISVIPIRVGGGMRVKILELMASGKPIVTSTIGAEGICYTKNKDILIADTENEFVSVLSELLNNSERLKSIGVNARKTVVSLYSWNSIISQYENYLRDVKI